ncbi:MAG: hypothetical protein IT439_08105 [Phycisphaerales bacterium]|nr:hypothetical protein [Phycisphaerales bacterium]
MRTSLARTAIMALLAGTLPAIGQTATMNVDVPSPDDLPGWVALDLASRRNDTLDDYRRVSREQKQLVRELGKLRRQYFRSRNDIELRQAGLRKLREYAAPENFPALLEVFRHDRDDVREAVLDLVVDQGGEDADAALAWASIFEPDAGFRRAALARLAAKAERDGGRASDRVTYIVAQTLKHSAVERELCNAAHVADTLNIIQVIPHLIAAQAGGVGGSGSGDGQGDRGWILVGRQVAFVSDLQPVVADSAVAFDPQLDVVTEGTLIRVFDAAVVTYITPVHAALVGLASRAYGRDLSALGYDQPRWGNWYINEFLPAQAAKEAAAAREASTRPGAAAPAPPVADEPARPPEPSPSGG